MSLVWTENTRPDRPGIWAMRNANGSASIREVTDQESWVFGTWCFICDLPEIKDPPKYREVTAADVGKMVEVGDRDGEWQKRKLVAVIPGNVQGKYVVKSDSDLGWTWFYVCRILDDGEPAKQPREWWIELNRHNGFSNWSTRKIDPEHRGEIVHVREVIDESAS